MKFFVALHQGNIITIEQPVDLLGREREQFIGRRWPFEFLLGERLVIEDKAVVLPHQTLDLVALTVGEGIEGTTEGRVSELQLDQCGKELLSNLVYGVGQAALLSDSSSTFTPSLNFTLFATNVSSANPLSRFHFFWATSSSL
jgi:hypothetical protein